jgi:hypothetical protein
VWRPDPNAADVKDIYAAVKVLAADARIAADLARLHELATHLDRRIALEVLKSLATRGDAGALARLEQSASLSGDDAPWAMEAVLILTEMGAPLAEGSLRRISAEAKHPEARAAAVWGLGTVGSDLRNLAACFTDAEADVVNHAVVAASRRVLTTRDTELLIATLDQVSPHAAAACETLSRALSPDISLLLAAANGADTKALWALACLSRRAPGAVRAAGDWAALPEGVRSTLERLWFWRLSSPFADAEVAADLDILGQQMFVT